MTTVILQNVKLLNNQVVDIVIDNKKISAIKQAKSATGATVIDCTGQYISSGWIDMHVHAFPDFDPYGDDIDEIGVKQGVTTIIDAGSCGADRIEELVENKKKAQTNVYAFLNISRIGLERIDELSNLNWIDTNLAKEAAKKYSDTIIGFKARISQSVVLEQGIEPLRHARKLSDDTGLPLMVHIGSGPPDISEVIPLLQKNDVITHFLNGKKNNLFDEVGRPLPLLHEAIARGVHLDVGHGNASFSFKVAEQAKKHGIHFNTISTDIYRKNRINGPVYSMASVLTKFLYLGYPLEEVIAGVTSNAAAWLRKPQLGRIQVGDLANLTLFTVSDKKEKLIDSEQQERQASKVIQTTGVVINGDYAKC
ncbi:amidohydrolase/deacetylase family metallohydrolase [Kurthia sibirica]|uniref:Amidohydrolase/deacetylase family metallohydrolase n=1 Tax=Kurthia sibirica TaxID=202750 RepID=A0A2U3AP63_9BACL|nr:amidohydrolase/deacetylase family metallohydrolase [Kurthia sibirica]PWI26324.1 amidohydrolase/deacetylase family metallohydrolase [Kurthia sibirica]GEK35008.1 dihydroorotase [Kurthia sibirica]